MGFLNSTVLYDRIWEGLNRLCLCRLQLCMISFVHLLRHKTYMFDQNDYFYVQMVIKRNQISLQSMTFLYLQRCMSFFICFIDVFQS